MSGFRSDSSVESIEDIRRRLRDREKQLEAEKKEAQAQEEKRRREEEREKQIAERSRQRKEKKKQIIEDSKLACKQRVSDLKLPNDSVLKKEFAKNEAEWARNKISKVNFNLLGKGSPQFDEMMESLNALKKYANRKNFDPAEYYDLQKKAIDKTRAYLQYKDEQLKNEPGRREDPKRQAHEQPRIASAVQVLERLEQSYAEGKKALIDRTQEAAKIRLDEEMKKIGHLRMAGDVYSDGQFDKSYWQSLHLYDKMKQIESIAPGNPKEELSLKEYVAEVDNNLAQELKQVNREKLSSYQKNYLDKFRQNGYMDSHFDQVMSDAVETPTFHADGFDLDNFHAADEADNIPYIDAAASYDEESGEAAVFIINRNWEEDMDVKVDLRGFEGCGLLEHREMYCYDDDAQDSYEKQEIVPAVNPETKMEGGIVRMKAKKLSFNMLTLKRKS